MFYTTFLQMNLEAVLVRKILTHSESFFLLINNNISGYQVQLACIGWQVFSLKIDLHCHIVLEHHFRISGIPSSKVKKLESGSGLVSHLVIVGGVCVRERQCWATPKLPCSSPDLLSQRCVWGRKDVISCVLPRLLRDHPWTAWLSYLISPLPC